MPPVLHILHVDQDEGARHLLSRAIFRAKVTGTLHSLSSASNALLYLNRLGPFADSPRPDVIIVDIFLPRSEGRQLHEILQSDERWAAIPLIILSNPATGTDIDGWHAMGMDHFRKKPQSEQECIALIQEVSRDHLRAASTSTIGR
jgi:chemotaxis family two-component system response regulator Rcp1